MELGKDFERFMTEYQKLQDEFQEKRKQAAAVLGESLHGTVKPIFDEFPELMEISWTQYTPYFNDGEPCVFGKNDVYMTFYAIDEDTGELLDETDEEKLDAWSLRYIIEKGKFQSYDPAAIKKMSLDRLISLKKVMDFLNGLDQDVCEGAFGEGKIVIAREGLEVEEYDHD